MHAETLRLLHNLVTVGTVSEVTPPKMRLTIGENTTDWVTIPAIAAGKLKVWRCPSVGEQFIIVSPSGDHRNARPICALPSDDNPSPSTDPDEVIVQFNETDYLNVNTENSTATFKISTLTVDSQTSTFTGDVQINGKLTANGIIKSLSDVLAKTISLFSHLTTGVQAGSQISGAPQ